MAALVLAATLAVDDPICNYTATFDHNHSLHRGKDNRLLAIDLGSISPTEHIDAHDNAWSEYYDSIGRNYTALLENRTFPTNHNGTMCSYVFMDTGAGWVPIEATQFFTSVSNLDGTTTSMPYLATELLTASPHIKLCRHFGSPEMSHSFEGLYPNTTYSLEVVLDNLRNLNLKAGNDASFNAFRLWSDLFAAGQTMEPFTCNDCSEFPEKIMVTCTGGTDFAVEANVADNTDPQNGVSETGMCTSDANGGIEVTFDLGFSYYEWTGPKLGALPSGENEPVRIPGAELPSLLDSTKPWCNYVTGTLFTGNLMDSSATLPPVLVDTGDPCTPFGNHTQAGVRLKSMKLTQTEASDNEECRVFHQTTNTRHPQSQEEREKEVAEVLEAFKEQGMKVGENSYFAKTVQVFTDSLVFYSDYTVSHAVVEVEKSAAASYTTLALKSDQITLSETCKTFGTSVTRLENTARATLKVGCDSNIRDCGNTLRCDADYDDISQKATEACTKTTQCAAVSVADGIVLLNSLPFVDEGSNSYKIAIAVIPNTDPDPADPTTYVWAAVGSVAGVTAVLVALYVGCSSDKSSTLYTRLGV